jgi:hypothetical protein
MPSYTDRDLTIMKDQVVRVYQNDGVTFLGTIPDAPYLTDFTEAVNAATSSITIKLPRKIDAFDGAGQPGSRGTIVLGNVVKYVLYGRSLPTTGLVRYVGIIDTITPTIAADGGESVDLVLTPRSQILGDHGIVGPINYGTAGIPSTYVDTGVMFSSWFTTQIDSATSLPYGSPFTLDPTNPATTGNTTQFLYQNQTLLSAFTNILLLSPSNFYFRMNEAAETATFNQYNLSTPNHFLKIGQHFADLTYSVDNVSRKNLIMVQGATNVQGIARGSSISGPGGIGARSYMKRDSRITDAHTAQMLANGLLAFYDRPQIRTKVTIPDFRGDALPGLGYDIEQFRVGQTVVILDSKAPAIAATGPASQWGSMVWGRDKWGGSTQSQALWGQFLWGGSTWGLGVGSIFNQIIPIVALHYKYHSVELELGFRQPNVLRSLFDLERRFQDATLIS